MPLQLNGAAADNHSPEKSAPAPEGRPRTPGLPRQEPTPARQQPASYNAPLAKSNGSGAQNLWQTGNTPAKWRAPRRSFEHAVNRRRRWSPAARPTRRNSARRRHWRCEGRPHAADDVGLLAAEPALLQQGDHVEDRIAAGERQFSLSISPLALIGMPMTPRKFSGTAILGSAKYRYARRPGPAKVLFFARPL